MRKKVYVETTIPSFYYNQRQEPEMIAMMNWTREWWKKHRRHYQVISSVAVRQELEAKSHPQQSEKIALLEPLNFIPITDEVMEVVEIYIQRKLMPANPSGDALHLALASVHECDILLTWNCAHLANVNKMDHLRRINALLNLPTPAIVTPLELMNP